MTARNGLDWRSLAAPLQTVVFYMGVAQLPRIVEHLRAHGAPRRSARRRSSSAQRCPEQRVMAGTLDDICELAQRAQVAAPALLIVGEVAARAARDDCRSAYQAGRSNA